MNTTLLFLGGIGMQEILMIGLVILVFFGAKKIPEFMKGLGKGVREFKDGVKEINGNNYLEETKREDVKPESIRQKEGVDGSV